MHEYETIREQIKAALADEPNDFVRDLADNAERLMAWLNRAEFEGKIDLVGCPTYDYMRNGLDVLVAVLEGIEDKRGILN